MDERVPTIAEVFRGAGYHTWALPAMSLLSAKAGFSRGFDNYVMDGLVSKKGWFDRQYYRKADDTVRFAQQYIRSEERPYFGWIHYFGIHELPKTILDLPAEFRRRYSEFAQWYDAKVTYSDSHFLSRVMDFVQKADEGDDTIIVLFSDHGEDLEKLHLGQWEHNWDIDEETGRIALLLVGPGVPPGRKIEYRVRSIDIFPTLCKLCEISPPPAVEGTDLLSDVGDRPVYAEILPHGIISLTEGDTRIVLRRPRGTRAQRAKRAADKRLRRLRRKLSRFGLSNAGRKVIPWVDFYHTWSSCESLDASIRKLKEGKGIQETYRIQTESGEWQLCNSGAIDLSSPQVRRVLSVQEVAQPGTKQEQVEAEQEAIKDALDKLGYL